MTRYLEFNRIRWTKILAQTWMEGFKRMVIGNRDGKIYPPPPPPAKAMVYSLDSSGMGLSWLLQWSLTEFGIYSGMRRGWYFSDFYFQRVHLVSGAINIRDRILSRIDLWNKGSYNELVQDSYSAAAAFLGKKCTTQTQDQCHNKIPNLILRRKLREEVKFICERETGGVFPLDDQATDSTGFTDKTVAEVLAKKPRPIENPIVLLWKHIRKRLFLFRWIWRRMWLSHFSGNFWGVQGLVSQTRRRCRVGY